MRSKVRVGDIYIRRLNGNSHFTAFVDVLHDIVSAPRHRCEQRRHEFHRVMRFQICGVISEQGVCRRMRFVKSVPGKLRHKIENLFDLLGRVAILHGAGHKAFALSGHLFGDFLAHRASQQIGFTERISSKAISDLHDLFLIDDYAQSLLQDFLQFRKLIFNSLASVLAIDEVINHAALNRPRPVERI